MGPGSLTATSRILLQLYVVGDITRHGRQTILEAGGQGRKHTSPPSADGARTGTMLSLPDPPPFESKITQAHRVESPTQRCIVQGLGRIRIGLRMSTGGMYTDLDVDA